MNFDIFIRVIDWFVSICETQHGKRPWLMEEEGGNSKTATFVRNLPITVLEAAQKCAHRSEQKIEKCSKHIH